MITIDVPFKLGNVVYIKNEVPVYRKMECPACKGRGSFPINFEAYIIKNGKYFRTNRIECENCSGTGQYVYIIDIDVIYERYILTGIKSCNVNNEVIVTLKDEVTNWEEEVDISEVITEEEYERLKENGEV